MSIRTMAATACLSLAATLPAAAQGGLEAIPALMRPEYFSRDLLLFIEGLELSDEQQVIVEIAFEDYEQDFNEGIEAMNDKITAIADQVDELRNDEDQLLATVLAPIQEWAIEREVLNDKLLEHVRVLLDAEQQERWTAFARQLYREKNLPHGVLAGESVNLFHVVRDMEMGPWEGTPIEVHMVAYDENIDNALRNRFTQSLVQPGSGFIDVIKRREAGSPEDVDHRRKMLDSRVMVRDVNDASIEQIAAAIGGEDGRTFRHEALKRGYGRIFRTTPAQRIFAAALEAQCVTDDPSLRTSVQNLFDEYLGRVDELNESILVATRDFEPRQHKNGIANAARRARGEGIEQIEDPTRQMYQDRREMGAEYMETLKELITVECFGTLDGARRFMPRAATNGEGKARPTGPPSLSSGGKGVDAGQAGRGLSNRDPRSGPGGGKGGSKGGSKDR
ncbi:MAG: hypothetical protein MK101_09210 [Phycisphaerales bacterium]|nr:hypothetical protein [Phycisphaerales bacterium]